MKFKNILFDLDGTIIKSDPGVTRGVKLSLEALGIEVGDESKLLKFLGPPLYDSYKKYYNLDYSTYEKALDIFHEYYRSTGIFECSVYEGLEESFKRLIGAGANLFVATSKPEPEAKRVIEHFNLSKYFKFIGGSDGDHGGLRSTKTAVMEYVLSSAGLENKSDILMIGDRYHDIVGAKNIGVKSMSVLYGYGNEAEFKEYGTDFIVNTARDVADFIISI